MPNSADVRSDIVWQTHVSVISAGGLVSALAGTVVGQYVLDPEAVLQRIEILQRSVLCFR
jgi:hypothetical protein